MSLARFALTPLACLLLAGPATAGASYDLQALMKTKPPVGAVVRVLKEEQEANKAPNPSKKHNKVGYVKTIEKVDKEGPSQFVLNLESFEDKISKTKVPVKGVRVRIVRKRTSPKTVSYSQKLLAGKPAPLVQAWLNEKYPATKKDKADEDQGLAAMVPTGKIEVGKGWTRSAAKLAELLFDAKEGVNAKQSKVSGIIAKEVKLGGHLYLEIRISLTFVFDTFQGMKCTTPLKMTMEMVALQSTSGERPTAKGSHSMNMKGVLSTPNGPVPLEMTSSMTETNALVKKP